MRDLFWVSFAALFYIYIGYPLLIWGLALLFGREPKKEGITPAVSFLIPAYDEEIQIEEKLRNTLGLDYPQEKLEIVVASDGSTDKTNAIVERYRSKGIRLIRMDHHVGKSAMLNMIVPHLKGEIIVFSDTSSHLEPGALKNLVRNFADPRVGCVCGLYRLAGSADLRSEGEGLYWKYETFIKRQESRLHSILGAHGALYAIRKDLFEPLSGFSINDDYLIPMKIVSAGYRAVYEPEAVAWEKEMASVEGEFARRRRIAAGNCQQVVELRRMLNPLLGWTALSFFSHKVLRTLAPLFMIALFISGFWLPAGLAKSVFLLQSLFYLAAYAGYFCQQKGLPIPVLSPVFYFCFGNFAMLAGLFRYLLSGKRVAWDRAR
ncbi:MAG: glycosyltransferase family 2 protein [Candidatus Omnitrophica bacterium]|nr:glycosyltransferase family 2 protein [Candidatus Omnitrophota bacterium]